VILTRPRRRLGHVLASAALEIMHAGPHSPSASRPRRSPSGAARCAGDPPPTLALYRPRRRRRLR
jgi:hypothetical protein